VQPPDVANNSHEYRSVSAVAIVAAVLGVVSLLVLATDEGGMWVLPALAVLVAVIALRQIATATPPKIGCRLAWLGLTLGVTLLVAAPIRHYSRLAWAKREAINAANEWIEHIRKGRRRAAHQWTLPLAARCPPNETLSHCYRSDPQRQEDLDAYISRRDVRQLLLWGEQAEYDHPTVLHRAARGSLDEVGLAYVVTLPHDDDPHGHPHELRVFMARKRDVESGRYYWIVLGVRLAEAAIGEAHQHDMP
jgi:hypothetical protein